MTRAANDEPLRWPILAFSALALTALVAPFGAMLFLADGASKGANELFSGPILALGMMGAGMIGGAITGRFAIGVGLAALIGLAIILTASLAVTPGFPFSASFAPVVLLASISFAARGALFARSGGGKGWWIALFVVLGEAAIIITAATMPGTLPDWLLSLLPAQWASMEGQSAAASGSGVRWISAPLIALGATAAATLFVVSLWPRKWTYSVMFTTWLAASALVYNSPAIF
ncbi:MAG: hypothetical protein AAFY19_08105 [Pseudomonadota bacterium]